MLFLEFMYDNVLYHIAPVLTAAVISGVVTITDFFVGLTATRSVGTPLEPYPPTLPSAARARLRVIGKTPLGPLGITFAPRRTHETLPGTAMRRRPGAAAHDSQGGVNELRAALERVITSGPPRARARVAQRVETEGRPVLGLLRTRMDGWPRLPTMRMTHRRHPPRSLIRGGAHR